MDNIENSQTQNTSCSVPLSKREKRIGRSIVVVGLIFLIIFISSAKATIVWGIELLRDNSGEAAWPFWSALILTALLLIIPSLAIFARWPGEVRYSGHIDIAATPADVWQKLMYQTDVPHWKGFYRQIEQLDGTGKAYRLHHYCWGDCTICGLPKHPNTPSDTICVNIVKAREPQFYHIKYFDEGKFFKLSEYAEDCFTIEALPNGNSRVDVAVIVMRPKLWMATLTKQGTATMNTLNDLKHHLEGRKNDDSMNGFIRARIAHAKAAPRHCGC
jgi:hypothetical protein